MHLPPAYSHCLQRYAAREGVKLASMAPWRAHQSASQDEGQSLASAWHAIKGILTRAFTSIPACSVRFFAKEEKFPHILLKGRFFQ